MDNIWSICELYVIFPPSILLLSPYCNSLTPYFLIIPYSILFCKKPIPTDYKFGNQYPSGISKKKAVSISLKRLLKNYFKNLLFHHLLGKCSCICIYVQYIYTLSKTRNINSTSILIIIGNNLFS